MTTSSLEYELLPAILETIDSLVVVLDGEGRIVLFNRASEELSGYREDEVAGTPFWDVLIPAHEGHRARLAFERAMQGHSLVGVEHPWVTRAGETRTLAWNTRTLPPPPAPGEFVLATAVDVTHRRRAEARMEDYTSREEDRKAHVRALETRAAKLGGVVALAPDAIVCVDGRQRITLFNKGAEEIFGYRADEVMGRPLDLLLPESSRARHGKHVTEFGQSPVQARQMGDRHEINGLRKDGSVFPAEASIVKLEVSGERIYAALLRDISAQVRAQERQELLAEAGEILSASLDYQETLRNVARLSVEGMADLCVVDIIQPDGRVERLEVAHCDPDRAELARRLYHFPLERSRPHLMSHALGGGGPELRSPVRAEDLRAVSQSREHLDLLKELDLHAYLVLPMEAQGRLVGTILLGSCNPARPYDEEDMVLGQEIARRAALAVENARLYRNAQRALKGRDEVLAVVSHDLGNPLQALSLAARGLQRSIAPEDDRGSYYLDAIRKSAAMMERLIQDLLEVRRMEADCLTMEFGDKPVAPMIDKAVALLEPLAGMRSVRLERNGAEASTSVVRADEGRIVQVLSNLVGNAVKHSEAGAKVEVRVDPLPDRIRISVSDSGPGIPRDAIDQVFQPSWRGRKSRGGGIGLGLTIARDIVEAHGGEIWVESTPGDGATFHFTLVPSQSGSPVHDAPVHNSPPEKVPKEGIPGKISGTEGSVG